MAIGRKIEQTLNDDKGELVQVKFLLHEKDKDTLQRYFKSKGIPWTTGIRMICNEYIKDKRL